MAAVHGKDTAFSIDNSAGTPVDITTYCDNVDFPGLSADTVEVSTFTADNKTYVAGLIGGTFSLSGTWDAGTFDATMYGIIGKTGTFSYTPGGAAIVYSGEAICTAYQVTSAIGAAVTWSASFQITGAVGRA